MIEDGTIEKREEAEKPRSSSKYWQGELALASKEEDNWRKRAAKVVEQYRDDQDRTSNRFNILWSNTETLKPALYARTAKPDVRRRFADQDPVGRQVAEIIERAVSYAVDQYDIDPVIENCVEDMLLAGRGVVRVDYEATIEEMDELVLDPMTGFPSMEKREYVGAQTSECKYVYWQDFRCSPARTWREVRWIAFRHYMTRKDVSELSPEHGLKVPLDYAPKTADETEIPDTFKRAEVWEIWDKDKRERIYVVCGYPEIIKREEDPYQLDGFFPVPEPLYGVKTTTNLVPIPEYTIYQDQARELDRITTRIMRLTEALKHRGVYNSSIKDLQNIQNLGDNEFKPMDGSQFAAMNEKGGLSNAFAEMDIQSIAGVLLNLYQQRSALLDTIYQITGISDLMRGATDARETATAQRIKGQFGSMRLQARQRRVQRFIRDLYRLKAEIMAEHYEPEILQQMTQVQVTPEAIDLLRNDRLRSYHVDIETDSTVFEDAEVEKAAVNEFLTSVTQFIVGVGPIAQQQPALLPLFGEMLSMGVRQHKAGRQIEETIERTMQELQQMAQQPQQEQPDPAAMKAQVDAQKAQQEIMLKMQAEQAKDAREREKASMDAQIKQMGLMMDADLEREEMMTEAELERRKQNLDAAVKQYAAERKAQQRTVN